MGRPRKVKVLEPQQNGEILAPSSTRDVAVLPNLLEIVGTEPVLSQSDVARAQSRIFSGVIRRALDVVEGNKLVWLLEQLGKSFERHANQKALEAKNSEPFTGIAFVPAKVIVDEAEQAYTDAAIVNGGTPHETT